MKISLWGENFPVDEALSLLSNAPIAQDFVMKELAKRILLERNFSEYKIESDEMKILMDKFSKSLKLETSEKVEKFLQKSQITNKELKEKLSYQDKLLKLKNIVINQEVVKETFLKRKINYDRIIFSIIRVKEKNLAKEIYHQIADDLKDFAEMARQFSVGEAVEQGGMIGPLPLSNVNPELRDVLLKLKPSEVTEPFSLDGQTYLLVQMNTLQKAQLNSYLEHSLRNELFEQWVERQIKLSKVKLT